MNFNVELENRAEYAQKCSTTIHIVVLENIENIFDPHYYEYHHVADNFKRMCHASLKLESNF